jgi:hypothetical protein
MKTEVRILRDNGQVVAPDCYVRKDDADWIEWSNFTTEDFTIHFDKSPFYTDTYIVKAGQGMTSGPLSATAAGDYKYDILVKAIPTVAVGQAIAADPHVIVH